MSSFVADKIVMDGLTFDDVLLIPAYSEVLPKEVELKTKFTRNISLNVPFVTGNEELDAKFVKEAAAAGFVNLKGHRTVGGMRASIYNAMPKAGVEKLVEFMKKFEEENA
jgi:phosphoserine aminotransferase